MLKSFDPLTKLPSDPNCNLEHVDELNQKKDQPATAKKFPSVKVRLFRKNSKSKRKSTLEFDETDFDVPLPKARRPKRVAFNPRISRSDWDLYDNRSGSDVREELEMLLSRNSKDLSIRSKSPEVEEDYFKSQYFDALETLSEDENEIEMTRTDHDGIDKEYEDIETEEKPKPILRRQKKNIDIKEMPLVVQRRVKSLKQILSQQKKVESEMFKDIHKLEGFFYKMHQNKIYNERLKLVEGVFSHSTIIEEDENGENPTENVQEQGIPGFWLRVLLNSKNLSQLIQVQKMHIQVRSTNLEPLFKCLYLQQKSLKPHQAWCRMKALVLCFPGMSLDMRF